MPTATATALANPFVGLRAFEESEDYLFFGRGHQVNELLDVLSGTRFLAVIGSSGSGKSSLVKSGLLPAIYSGFLTVGHNWRAVSMRPGEDPIGYLAKALATEGALYQNAVTEDVPREWMIEATLRRSENGLVQAYKDAHLPDGENLLIVVDQFEELFRFSRYEKEAKLGKSDAIHFIQVLLTAAQQKESPVYVLLTMRADFLGDCAEFRGLPEAINEGQYLIPRMKRDEIREAITGPVAVSGATITQRLVTRLLNDINNDTDQLPILQHALMRTWEAWFGRKQYNKPIDFEDYEAIGTMRQALSLHGDEAYAELPAADQLVCEAVFKALTDKAADVRGIRRPRSIEDLCELSGGSEAQVMNVVETFRKKGRTFLMPPPAVPLTKASVIDISHESLMRVWERLKKWIDEEARNGDVYLRLAGSAQLHGEGQRGLLKDPELQIALNWKEERRPTPKWAEGYNANFAAAMRYLDESRREDLAEKKAVADKEAQRRKMRRTLFGLLGLMLVAAVILAVYFNNLKKDALAQKATAETQRMIAEAATHRAKQSDSATQKALARTEAALLSKDSSERKALVAFLEAHKSDSARKVSLDFATQKKKEADDSAAVARQERDKTQAEKEKVETQNRKIAANEYARLIREGPSEENKNKQEFYDRDYLLAYTYHFNQLENLLAPEDKAGYASLRNKLYYNNDLYKRLYEAFVRKRRDEVIRKEDGAAWNAGPSTLANGAKVFLKKSESNLTNGVAIGNYVYTLPKGETFTSLAVSKKKGLVFCGATNNVIFVFNEKGEKTDAVAMGTKVTALDAFDDDNRSIIYFGTVSGYIGYILYDAHKKAQPVFENKLESEITAIEAFRPGANAKWSKDETFLLATGLESPPKVYKLDKASLKPDKLLFGNELPYTRKTFGQITGAQYDEAKGRVLLQTSTGTWSWNPFSLDLLNKLNVDFHPSPAFLDGLKLY